MRAVAFLVFLSLTLVASAQTGVGIEIEEVIDNRMSGEFVGGLELRVKLKGNGLDKANAARVVVKEAKDDRGNVLPPSTFGNDFTPREYNSGMLQLQVGSPARAANIVSIKGTVELFVPTRDPNAVVKVDKPFSKLDAPLSNAKLKSSKLSITPLSTAGYAERMKARKLDDAKIEQLRAEGKKQGIPEKEIELAIEMAKAFDSMDTPPAEGAVLLAGTKADFDRIFRVDLLGADGKPLDTNGRSTSTRGDDALMTLQYSTPPAAGAAMQIYVLTAKSQMSFPFELKVNLP